MAAPTFPELEGAQKVRAMFGVALSDLALSERGWVWGEEERILNKRLCTFPGLGFASSLRSHRRASSSLSPTGHHPQLSFSPSCHSPSRLSQIGGFTGLFFRCSKKCLRGICPPKLTPTPRLIYGTLLCNALPQDTQNILHGANINRRQGHFLWSSCNYAHPDSCLI